ncbi:MAG: methyltransferase domain-containing protein [bacterium]
METFDPSAFEKLKEAEEKYFWFQIRRKWIFDKINRFSKPPATMIEVGCGTGNVSSYLAQRGYRVTGCEYYGNALEMAWPGFEKICGDAANLPFKDNSFDIVGLFDVIEHFQDDSAPLKEAKRVVKDNGFIAVTVPAREELWSSVDEEAFHKRRYTKLSLDRLFHGMGLEILLHEYMFMSLYFPMKHIRRKGLKQSDEQFKINSFMNLFLTWIFNTERIGSRYVPLPIGTSLIVVARKKF